MSSKRNLRTFDNIRTIDFLADPNFDPAKICHYDIAEQKKKTLFILENLLTQDECETLKSRSDPYYETLSGEFDKDERQADRVLAIDNNFATILFNRISNYLDNSKRKEIPFGFGTSGVWTPDKINPCFRYSKYNSPSIGFKPHRDSSFIEDEDHRSLLTVIIYLNGNFEGGKTTFYKPLNKRNRCDTVDDEVAKGTTKKFEYVPKTGSCVIFNHNMIHSGDPVFKGSKYIIRTDIIYKRVERPADYSYGWMKDEYYHKAIFLYREAINQELDGNLQKASILYQQQLAIRQTQKNN